MKFRKPVVFLAFLCLTYVSSAIIYRHDVQRSKFLDLSKDQQFDCVGLICDISGDTNRVAGSCVLIGDRYVLTAWHVFDYGADVKMADYKIIYHGRHYAIEKFLPYPQKGHDMVVVKLADNVDSIRWATLNTIDQVVGDTITMVGYGGQRPSDMFEGMISIGIKAAAQNIIDSISGVQIDGRPSRLYADFDSPVAGPRILLPLEGMLNGGDSGGGMFIRREGKYLLAGIASGSHMCFNTKTGFDGSTMYWCNVAAYCQWIEKCMKEL